MINRRWSVNDVFGRPWRLWIRRYDETGGLPRDQARSAIRGLLWAPSFDAGHDRYATLLDVHAELTGRPRPARTAMAASLGMQRSMWEHISEALERAASFGRLCIEPASRAHPVRNEPVARARPVREPPARARPAIVDEDVPDTVRDLHQSLPEPAVRAWVAIELVDGAGRPIAGQRYRIELPDGEIREGALDESGSVTVMRTEPGTCQIECPFHAPAAATTHIVAQGEHAPGIAALLGFDDFREIWNHTDNAELRARRPSPAVLAPGDELHVPARASVKAARATGARHRFVLKEAPLKLRVRLQDFLGRPIGKTAVELVTSGGSEPLITNDDGQFEADIATRARDKQLLFDEVDLPLAIGFLDPIDLESGRNARLANLGYLLDPSDTDEDDEVYLAIEEFQADNGLPTTGVFNTATRAQLLNVYGC